ncbi:smoothelin-like protein 1 isoform X49 [Orcinus orca]|uniref:smoothelin-like protein 1 isoform X48 n=1 Tax=Orcinus orca TaxID=9733 RepID=UPI0021127806|nr:smoothelin-like protein 1 isoform X48 [Orcinus orca]XP_049569677.1 smoothelin-like protein 1 isoform X49 [Orcinus orca]
MEQKEGKPSEDGTPVSPTMEVPETVGGGASAEEEATGPAERTITEGPPDGAGKQERAPAEDSITAEFQGESKGEAELQKEDSGKKETTVAPQEMADRKEETNSEPKETEGKEEITLASEKQQADEKEAKPGSREKANVNDEVQAAGNEEAKAGDREAAGKEEAKAGDREAAGKEEAKAGGREAAGKQEATVASQEVSNKTEEPKAETQEKASAPEAKSDSQKTAVEDEAKPEPQEEEEKEEVEPGCPDEEQDQGAEKGAEEGAGALPRSAEEWPESPTEEGSGLSPDGLSPDTAASGETSPSASESSPSDVSQSPTEPPPSQEKKKDKAPERRVSAPARPRGPRAQNRKAIVDKFGGAASGPTALFRNTKAAGAAIGGVKNMLLEWCRAMTRSYEHVDIQNFSSSWSSGMAFCALIHKFFPDAFDYAALDPAKRRHNFSLAFSTAEKLADCAQLLEVDDMVRLAVPDSKCVYTYIQELYRSLVQKGLVKTKKK